MRTVLILLCVGLTAAAWADGVDTLIPTAVVDYHWDTVGDTVGAVVPPDDAGTTVISSGTADAIATFELSAQSIPGGATVDSFVVSTRAAANPSGASYAQGIIIGNDSTESSPILCEDGFTVYNTVTNKLACPGGREWTAARLDSAQVYVIMVNDVHGVYLTTIRGLVHYTVGAAAADNSIFIFKVAD